MLLVCLYAEGFIFNIVIGGFRPSSGRGGSSGGGRSQGWVDYDYDYEAAGIERRGNNNRVSVRQLLVHSAPEAYSIKKKLVCERKLC